MTYWGAVRPWKRKLRHYVTQDKQYKCELNPQYKLYFLYKTLKAGYLSPWSRVNHEEPHTVKKFLDFYETGSSISVFTK